SETLGAALARGERAGGGVEPLPGGGMGGFGAQRGRFRLRDRRLRPLGGGRERRQIAASGDVGPQLAQLQGDRGNLVAQAARPRAVLMNGGLERVPPRAEIGQPPATL